MSNNELEIILKMRDLATSKMKRSMTALQAQARKVSSVFNKMGSFMQRHWIKITALIVGAVYAIKKLSEALIKAGDTVEQYQVRLQLLLGSMEEGNKVFQDMSDLASRVPKTYEEIMASATDLSAVVSGGSEEIKKLMPIIVDLAAGTGMSVREVTGQMIRMYSAGAASADMFRERGVSAALGFQAGVSYSAEQTMKTMTEQWEDGTGKFVGAAKGLANTWTGVMSMMSDAWFQFKVAIGEKFFEKIKTDFQALLAVFTEFKDETGKYEAMTAKVATGLATAYEHAKNFVSMLLLGAGHIKDAWDAIVLFFEYFNVTIQTAAIGAQNLSIILAEMFWIDSTPLREALADMEEALSESLLKMDELQAEHNINYSSQLQEQIVAFKAMFAAKKEEIAAAAAVETKTEAVLHKAKIKTIDKEAIARKKAFSKQVKYAMEGTASTVGSIATMLEVAQGESKKYGAAIKALRIGETIINTASAIMRAWAEVPYPANIAMAVAAAAAGAAQIATIAAQPMAEGGQGVVTKPTLFLAGEAGAEAFSFSPLSKGGGTGGNIYVEINNPSIRSDDDIDDLVEAVSRQLAYETDRIR